MQIKRYLSLIFTKLPPAGGGFSVKLFARLDHSIYIRQAETKARLALSHNIHITSSKHLHKNLFYDLCVCCI